MDEDNSKCSANNKSCNGAVDGDRSETVAEPTMHVDDNSDDTHLHTRTPPDAISFWAEDPNVLLDPAHLTELFPSAQMTYNQKLNAITRCVLFVSVIVFAITRSSRSIMISAITLVAIYLVHNYDVKEKEKERFSDLVRDTLDKNGVDAMAATDVFQPPEPSNPFSNVLISDYSANPNKKPAPPAYNRTVSEDILAQAKQLVRQSHPNNPDIADKLFQDLGDQYEFEQSLRPFYSTANTIIPNDQNAFAQYCYGSMISCKEGNQFACARNLSRHIEGSA